MAFIVDIPNELLHKIFEEIVSYSEGHFRNPSMIKPEILDPNFWPSSTVLLVCKRWLRVATPVLYHTVVIRNVAQGQALEDVFLEKPSLPPLVRRLRVESSWDCLGPIIKRCINIEIFLVILDVHPSEAARTFCGALRYIRPIEVVLCPAPKMKDYKKVKVILEAFADVIPKWDKLTKFELPASIDTASDAVTKLATALSVSPSMQMVFADVPRTAWPAVWNPLATNTKIAIYFRYKVNLDFRTLPNLPPEMLSRLHVYDPPWPYEDQFHGPSRPGIRTRPISLKPLLSQPIGVVRVILTKIFTFAFFTPDMGDELYAESYQKDKYVRAVALRRNLSLTCRLFAMVMRPIVYRYPIFLNERKFFMFVNIVTNKSFGKFVWELLLDFRFSSWENFNSALCALLPHLTNLRRFNARIEHKISFRALEVLAGASGDVLVDIDIKSWEIDDVPHLAALWNNFKRLRRLKIEKLPDLTSSYQFISPSCLSKVDNLHVKFDDVYVVRFLSHLKLPNLTVLTVTVNSEDFKAMVQFLQRYGQHLTDLMITAINIKDEYYPDLHNYCANLRVLRLKSPFMDHMNRSMPVVLANFTPLQHLEALDLTNLIIEGRNIAPFLRTLDLDGYPRLKKILVNYKWPQSEREIRYAKVTRFAVRMKNEYGVDVVGTGETMWRPRLQPRR